MITKEQSDFWTIIQEEVEKWHKVYSVEFLVKGIEETDEP